jgi:hypothetical protein
VVMGPVPADVPDFYRPTVHIGQLTAVFDAAKWYAHESLQLFVYGWLARSSGSPGIVAVRTVPAGKTYFVTCVSGAVAVDGGANVLLDLQVQTVSRIVMGGVGGNGMPFDTPIRVEAGETVRLLVTHFGTGSQVVHGAFGGYDES